MSKRRRQSVSDRRNSAVTELLEQRQLLSAGVIQVGPTDHALATAGIVMDQGDQGTGSNDNSGGETFVYTTNASADRAPTDIRLSSAVITENKAVGTLVGKLSSTDPDRKDAFTYSLVSGAGSTDNASFTIVGNYLKTAATFDFESKSTYSIRVRTTDQKGLSFEKSFTINITNVNEAPTGISLSNATIPEQKPAGTIVGTLSATDPDAGSTFHYSIIGGADRKSFKIVGNQLQLARPLDYETKSSYTILLRVKDQGGKFYDKPFTITATDINEAPTSLKLVTATIVPSVKLNAAADALVGTFSATDPDHGNTLSYSLISGVGSDDNARFTIRDNQLRVGSNALSYTVGKSYRIRVQVTDQGGLSYQKTFVIKVVK